MRGTSLSMLTAGLLLVVLAAAAAAAPITPPAAARPDTIRVVQAPVDVPPGHGARIAPLPAAAPADTARVGEKDYSLTVRGRFVYQRQDGRWAGVDGILIEIWDDDGWWGIEQLSSTHTDADGNFSRTFTYTNGADDPDIWLRIRASSEHAFMMTEDTVYGYGYGWDTGIVENYGGTDLDWGTLTIAEESEMWVLHLLTALTRVHRWIEDHGGGDAPRVTLAKRGSGSCHPEYYDDTLIICDHHWREDTLAALYGHHWLSHFSTFPGSDLCNGVCDEDDYCSSCYWCGENAVGAYLAGWSDWLADAFTRSLEEDYGLDALSHRDFESLDTCEGSYADPLETEGFLAAALRDIEDAEQDTHGVYGDWSDALALGPEVIFTVASLDQPVTSWQFLMDLAARLPARARDVWETGKNCGIDCDVEEPGAVTNLTSSHAVGATSPDRTVEFFWTNATDDISGLAGYGLTLSTAAPALPAATQDIPVWNHYTSAILAPGTYYFCIRAVDRDGRWSDDYVSYGPFTIRAAEPADLEPYLAAGWARELVPRATNDAISTNVTEPTTLSGNGGATYWNVRGRNSGESATTSGFHVGLAVDGAGLAGLSFGAAGAGVSYYAINRGPLTIRGGRHTFEAQHDDLGALSEPDEIDNFWAHQWIWTPPTLMPGTLVTRAAPPDRAGGWSSVVDGSTTWYNCDGLRFSSSGEWNAVVTRPLVATEDYDCRLHTASTGAGNGFAANTGWSARGAGLTDAVLVNRNEVGLHNYDVGVIESGTGGGDGDYQVVHVTSTMMAVGDSVAATLPLNHMLLLREFSVTAADTGWITVTVDVAPAQGPVQAAWFDEDFTVGDLQDFSLAVASNVAGRARMHMRVTGIGHHGLAVFRDQTCGAGAAALPLVIEIERTLPDFEPYLVAGWHSPLVPRPASDGTAGSVALPDTLHGNASSSYYNFAFRNNSPSGWNDPGNTSRATVCLDGEPAVTWSYTSMTPNQVRTTNSTTARTVRGGRHTLALMLDRNATIDEIDETDNDYGEQYCWSPLGLALATPVARAGPPDRIGGWAEVPAGVTTWFNCDGLRSTVGGGYWTGVAVMPGAASDVDVRMHPQLDGAQNGFAANLAISGWGAGQSDFVLVNHNATPFAAYDAGVLRQSGAEGYTAEGVTSLYCLANEDGTFGPWTLPANRILDLREFRLTAGLWAFRLDNLSGNVDWGISLHPAGTAFQKKSTLVSDGAAWLNGAGQDEWFTVTIPTTDYYCLAVWKTGAAELAKAGTYRLRLHAGVTGVDDGPPPAPAATALVSVHPNPFNPRTNIVYDLATAGLVKLEVYDLRGLRVRTLVAATRPAGRHEAAWDGRDDAGQVVACGTYVARLQAAGGPASTRKLVLLK
ncbi:MAG: FlgD immunoglobulin-like domain containing protein [Candidatus Latescibacteria bacterium]|nr:FlgD immunoglobulin-like domain containing protein [Candidatus Latescibacterota bacterium]